MIIEKGTQFLEIVVFCRLIESSTPGLTKMCTQCNEVEGEYYSTKHYRDQFLKDLSACIKQWSIKNRAKHFALIVYMTQNVEETVIIGNGLVNTAEHVDKMTLNTLDNMHKHGKKCADIVIHTCGFIDYADRW